MNIEFNASGDVLQMELNFGLTKAGTDQLYATKAELATETTNRQTADTNEVTARNNAIAAETAARTAAVTAEATARAAADTAEVTARNQAIAAQAALDAAAYETKAHAAATYLKNAFVQITDAYDEYVASSDEMKIVFLGKDGIKVSIDKANSTIYFDGHNLDAAIATKLSASTAASTYATIASLASYMTAGFAKMKVGSTTANAATKTATMTFADAGGISLSLNTSTNTLTIDGSAIKDIALAAIANPAIEGANGDVLTTDGNGGRHWQTPINDMIRYSSQTLSHARKTQARNNIDAAYTNDVGALNGLHTSVKTSIVDAINEIVDSNDERVSVTLTPSEGAIEGYVGSSLSILIADTTTPISAPVDNSGHASFIVPKGKNYTITYPTYVGYTTPAAETIAAALATRTIVKVYTISAALEDVATSIVMEESSNPQWTRGGNLQAIAQIIGTYGSYVIDPVHKKYALLDPTNGAKFADGTAWSGTYGEAFRRFPAAFKKVVVDQQTGKSTLWLSKRGISTSKFEETWIGSYKGVITSGKLHSRPNGRATGNTTMSNFFAAAQALGTDFGLVNYFDHCYLNALHLLAYGDANSENTMGAGLQDGGYDAAYYSPVLGCTAALGDATGNMPYIKPDGTTHATFRQNRLFGIEGLAGSQWEFRPNIRFSGNDAIVYKGNQVSNTIDEGHADFVRKFTRLGSANQAFIKQMAIGNDFDLIPTLATGGSSSTYWCDGTWASASGQLLLVGGSSSRGASCGLSAAFSSYDFSYSYPGVGARLAFRGNIAEYAFITGAEMAAINANP